MIQFIWEGICIIIFIGIVISLFTVHDGVANDLSIVGFLMIFLLVISKYIK